MGNRPKPKPERSDTGLVYGRAAVVRPIPANYKLALSYTVIVVVVLLLQVFWQDLKSRTINIAILASIMCLVLFNRLPSVALIRYGIDTGLNLFWVSLQLLMLTVYFSVRQRAFTIPIGKAMGLGDVAFWLVPVLSFSPEGFVSYWIASMVFALAVHGCLRVILKKRYAHTIPLAGYQALWMAANLTITTLLTYR